MTVLSVSGIEEPDAWFLICVCVCRLSVGINY